MTILVTGGTGNLGRLVVQRLLNAGEEVRVLSRRELEPADAVHHVQGDLTSGEGIAEACAGVATIVHCAGAQTGDDRRAEVLVEAAGRAGVGHLVHISVVGADRLPVRSRTDRMMFGYFESKRGAEEAVMRAGTPYSLLRATQFHDLMFTVVQALSKLPVVPVPRVRVQPVQAGAVAGRLVELALGEPLGVVPDLGGPAVHTLNDLVRSYLRTTGRHLLLAPVPLPGRAAKVFRGGANLLDDRGVTAGTGWEAFLAVRLGTARKAPVAQP